MDKKQISPTQRLWKLLKPDSKEVRNIHFYSIFNGLVSLSLPLGIQAIINLIQGGQVSTSWKVLIFFVVLGIAVVGLLQVFQLRITENLQQKIFTRAAFEFSYRIPKIKMEALYKHYAPELMNRFFDINSIQKGLSKILIDFSSAAFIVVFSLILLSFYHAFFIVFGLILLILVYVIFRFIAHRGMATSLEESKVKYQVAHWLEELSRTATTFKLAGKSELPLERTNNFVTKYLKARENHFRTLVQQYSLLIVFKVIITGGLLFIGGLLVIQQQMNIGQFIAAEIIILVVLSSVEKLIFSLESIYDILTSLEKVGFVTDMELDRDSGVPLENTHAEEGVKLELNNIHFKYPESEKNVLSDVSLTLKKGEKCLIIGHPGSGKSTLLHVITGLYDVSAGAVSYNDFPLGSLNLESVRDTIGEHITMEQLFEGSLLENISLGREVVTLDDVIWAVENLGLSEFVKSLPQGYNTVLKAQGNGLSESIVAKILIARSIANKPRLLLLENSFEYLDAKSRKEIIDFLFSEKRNWTILFVAPNSYLAKRVDKIVILKAGKITNVGTFKQLEKEVKEFEIDRYA